MMVVAAPDCLADSWSVVQNVTIRIDDIITLYTQDKKIKWQKRLNPLVSMYPKLVS